MAIILIESSYNLCLFQGVGRDFQKPDTIGIWHSTNVVSSDAPIRDFADYPIKNQIMTDTDNLSGVKPIMQYWLNFSQILSCN